MDKLIKIPQDSNLCNNLTVMILTNPKHILLNNLIIFRNPEINSYNQLIECDNKAKDYKNLHYKTTISTIIPHNNLITFHRI